MTTPTSPDALTADRMAQIRARVEAATAGNGFDGVALLLLYDRAPADLLYLLDALAASQAEAAGLRAALERIEESCGAWLVDNDWAAHEAQTALASTPTPHATRGAALLRDEGRARALRAAIDEAGPLLLRGQYAKALSVLTRAAADDGQALGEYEGMGHGEVGK